MPIEFVCPRCHGSLRVADDEAGTKQRCPHCQGKVRVPEPAAASAASAGAVPPGAGAAIEFLCPRCQTAITVPAAEAGARQRCPQCQGKVRVPAPAAVRRRSPAIDFLCPRCRAPMSARPEHVGVKQFCPRCGGKVRVPAPSGPAAPAATVAPVPAAEGASPADAALAGLVDDDSLDGLPLTRRRRQRGVSLGWLLPVLSLGLLAAVGAVLLRKPPIKLEGRLTGERITDLELGPFRIDNRYLGRPPAEAQRAFESLETSPLRAASPSLTCEFRGVAGGISLSLRVADKAGFVRIDPAKDKRLADFVDRNKSKFQEALESELRQSVPAFVEAVEQRGERSRDIPRLAEFRDSVALASLMRGPGFGFYVQAAVGKEAFPCLAEDNQGRLFFALPSGTKEFELVGRDRGSAATGGARFSGRYTVHLAEQPITINKEAPDANEKVRKLLKQ